MRQKDRNPNDLPECCRPVANRRGQGILSGIIYGLAPHTFCILFIVLSVIGATAASSFVGRILFVPYLFQIIVALSLVFATLSAVLYLRRNGLLSRAGIRRKWRYLSVMYGTTLAINVLFFWVIFPAVANLDLTPRASAAGLVSINQSGENSASNLSAAGLETVTLEVEIPCPGHAPLIISELKKAPGVQAKYQGQNRFEVSYDAMVTSLESILAQPVFQAFPAEVLP
jgi:hypothetical protein